MNAQTQKDQSYYTMIAEHQELSARVLRLHNILNQHHCVQHMPTEACILINEMKNIVDTGKAHPDGLETAELDFDDALPFTDPEINTVHDFQVGDTVWIPMNLHATNLLSAVTSVLKSSSSSVQISYMSAISIVQNSHSPTIRNVPQGISVILQKLKEQLHAWRK